MGEFVKPARHWSGWASAHLFFDVRNMDPEASTADSYLKNFREDFEQISEFDQDFAQRVASSMLARGKLFTPTRWLRQLREETRPDTRARDIDDFLGISPEAVLKQWEKRLPDARTMLKVLRDYETNPLDSTWNGFVPLVNFAALRLAGNDSHIDEVALSVVRAYLRLPGDISDVTETCKKAQIQAQQIFSANVRGIVHSRLNGIVLLLSDPDGAGVSKLSGEFRRLARPDLALAATASFELTDPRGEAVWTSRAAAYADLEEFDAGLKLCKAVWAKSPSHFVCTVRSRIHRHLRQNEESHRWAKEGWSREESKETAQTLAASSVLVGDLASLKTAAQFLGLPSQRDDDSPIDPYIVVRAGWFLQREGNAGAALQVAEQVLSEHPDYPPAVQLRGAARTAMLK